MGSFGLARGLSLVLPLLVCLVPETGSPAGPADLRQKGAGSGDEAGRYAGPGREEADPEGLAEVRLGYFGPSDPSDLEGREFWRGASLALEDVNASGGYRGLPFRLVPGWSASPWRSGAARLARLLYEDGVFAVVGSIDGASSHLAAQVAAKSFVTVVSPGSTDATVNMAHVPWVFSPLPSDAAQAPLVAGAVLERGGDYLVLSTTDHDARIATTEILGFLGREGSRPVRHLEWSGEEADLPELARTAVGLRPRTALVLSGARSSARILKALVAEGFEGRIVGGATMGRTPFAEDAGSAAEGAVFPLLYEPSGSWDAFAARYLLRYGAPADYAAGQAYDAVELLAAAVRKGGLNRARIVDGVRDLSPWRGVMGRTEWDALGQNDRTPCLGTIRGGRVVPEEPSR